ncbi:HPP family protein [Pantoea sp. Ap-967]|uniref:HPP family protein n=1 Tax=Pantoea sp. Ap-967 TaxID=2608362 RepID=UPI00141EEF57|nr:HPP family protein [Pantoea sp. Ap-967]NIE78105.1 HPP family protein [Pantoea sp. Ap-967]
MTASTTASSSLARRRPAVILLAGLGSLAGLGALGALAHYSGNAWVMGSFGASCVLLFGFPDGPFSRPRNLIGGHLLSTTVGLLVLHYGGTDWYFMALAGALALMLMLATDTVHPPAGSNPVIIFLAQPGWDFLVMPTLAGVLVLLVISQGWRWGSKPR